MTDTNPLEPAAAPDAAHEASSPSSPSSDPASSLRAAALLTLKSKRRRPAGGTSAGAGLPVRPAPAADGGAQLDYGQEDVASSPPAQVSEPAQSSQATDIQDGQTREEGEISDSEEQLALSAKALPSKASPAKHQPRKPSPPPPPAPKVSMEPPVDLPPPRPSPKTVIPKQESPPHPLERITDNTLPAPPSSSGMTGIDESHPKNSFYVDENHVRPGLALTQTQYDTCKDVILDLLGWGVPTDYLMSCGLSREVIYFVFTELNLRLPPNFDPTGLVPYIPEVGPTFAMPPPPIPLDVTTSPHHGLPPRPPIPGQSYPHTPTTPSTAQSLDGNSLHDMERLRREELRARKMAVQATRKPKPSPGTPSMMSSSHPASTQLGQDVEMTSAQNDSVDDFLKTIEPTPEHQGDAMDLDEIPGLGGSQSASHSPTPPSQPVVVGQILISSTYTSNNGSTGSLSTASLDGQGSRRRPVAADFVDMEGHAKNGNGVHSDTHARRLRRAKNSSSFASVGKMRRLVINLSDSEEDADGDYHMGDSGEHEPSSTIQTVVRTQSPAILAEKEKEIARIKQLIAEREMQKLHYSCQTGRRHVILELYARKWVRFIGSCHPSISHRKSCYFCARDPINCSRKRS
ncbi:hypothetical protein BDZ89DRAFT_325112 [Hymenopellis radicata]|nr:hypothetical protein BDZ89DRAFT_325112 [Hymenopellis radicata]